MNKQALGLSALGFLLFTAPAFAQEKTKTESTESKNEQDVGKKGSSYKSEQATKSSGEMKSSTDEGNLEKSTKTKSKSSTDTEVTPTTKQPAGSDEKASKTTKSQKKTDTESSSTAKPDKSKD